MGENAELWTFTDELSQRIAVTSWLKAHNIEYSDDETTDELIQVYRDVECGILQNLFTNF